MSWRSAFHRNWPAYLVRQRLKVDFMASGTTYSNRRKHQIVNRTSRRNISHKLLQYMLDPCHGNLHTSMLEMNYVHDRQLMQFISNSRCVWITFPFPSNDPCRTILECLDMHCTNTVYRRYCSNPVHCSQMGIPPHTAMEARLENQLVVGSIKQVDLEPLLEGRNGGGRPNVWW